MKPVKSTIIRHHQHFWTDSSFSFSFVSGFTETTKENKIKKNYFHFDEIQKLNWTHLMWIINVLLYTTLLKELVNIDFYVKFFVGSPKTWNSDSESINSCEQTKVSENSFDSSLNVIIWVQKCSNQSCRQCDWERRISSVHRIDCSLPFWQVPPNRWWLPQQPHIVLVDISM